MTGKELIDHLRTTGSGDYYLRPFLDVLATRVLDPQGVGLHEVQGASAWRRLREQAEREAVKVPATDLLAQVEDSLRLEGERRDAYKFTMAKARHIAAGKDIDELMGKAPRQSREAQEERLARILSEANADLLGKVLERRSEVEATGVGRPVPPAGSENKRK